MQQNIEPLVVSVRKDGSIFLQRHRIQLQQLAPRIKAMRKEKPGLPVFIRGDAKVPYELIARVISRLATAGIRKVGLVTEPRR